MQENYENVISLAEEIAISWPRITAFAESHRRRGLAPVSFPRPEELLDSLVAPTDDGMMSDNGNEEEEEEEEGEVRTQQDGGGTRGEGGEGNIVVEKVDAQHDPLPKKSKEKASDEGQGQKALEEQPKKPLGKKQGSKPVAHRGFKKLTPRGHHGLLSHAGRCLDCGKGFGFASKASTKPYQCSECGKGFNKNAALSKHRRAHHAAEKPYVCEDCGKSFGLNGALLQHRRTRHPDVSAKPYTCSDCGKSFAWSSHLDRHQRIHAGDKPFHCDDCGKGFSQSSHLERHQRVHRSAEHPPCRCMDCFQHPSFPSPAPSGAQTSSLIN
uniref:Uncharacterized protein n=1 Tax=Sphaerodactylus townsendi TaxID=933632 RepID=A0ACB8EGE4_9SAUR